MAKANHVSKPVRIPIPDAKIHVPSTTQAIHDALIKRRLLAVPLAHLSLVTSIHREVDTAGGRDA
jgi:hypothetical protein